MSNNPKSKFQTGLLFITAISTGRMQNAFDMLFTKKDSIDFSVQDSHGRTALMWACLFPNFEMLAFDIINTGKSNPGAQDLIGRTALIIACQYNNSNIALALIATGKSNPGAQNYDGQTALMFACKYNNSDVALALIETGESNYMARDKYGKTAFDYASPELAKKIFELTRKDTFLRRKNIVSFFNQYHPHGAGTNIGNTGASASAGAGARNANNNAKPCPNCIRNGPHSASGLCTACTEKLARKGSRGRGGSRRGRNRRR